jgi:hypothetical protein
LGHRLPVIKQEALMQHRTQVITTPQGWRTLSVQQQVADGATRYVGAIDGHACVTAMTPEAAANALFRRVIQSVVQ